jgi:hypothetical protein
LGIQAQLSPIGFELFPVEEFVASRRENAGTAGTAKMTKRRVKRYIWIGTMLQKKFDNGSLGVRTALDVTGIENMHTYIHTGP